MGKLSEPEQVIGGGIFLFFTFLGIEYIMLYSTKLYWLAPYLLITLSVYWIVFIKALDFSFREKVYK